MVNDNKIAIAKIVHRKLSLLLPKILQNLSSKKHPRANSLWALAGMAAIIITLLWVNLSRLFPGLHSYASSM